MSRHMISGDWLLSLLSHLSHITNVTQSHVTCDMYDALQITWYDDVFVTHHVTWYHVLWPNITSVTPDHVVQVDVINVTCHIKSHYNGTSRDYSISNTWRKRGICDTLSLLWQTRGILSHHVTYLSHSCHIAWLICHTLSHHVTFCHKIVTKCDKWVTWRDTIDYVRL